MIDSAVTLLPQPDSPTMPSVAAGVEREARRRRPRAKRAVVGAKADAQVARLRAAASSRQVSRCAGKPRRSPASITARSVMPAGSSRLGRNARKCTQRSRLTASSRAQFGERIGVVVDAQVERRILLGGVDQQRGRLLAALVAARGLAGLHAPRSAARRTAARRRRA